MGILGRFGKLFRKEKATGISAGGRLGGLSSRPAAMSNATFWSCVIQLASQYASLPVHAFENGATGKRKLGPDTLLGAILKKPNPLMTPYTFFFVMGINFELHGEAVAIIERASNGLPIALWPCSPAQMIRHWEGDELMYRHAISGNDYSHSDILIMQQLPTGYETVLSPIQYASDDVDLERKCRSLQAEYYDGGAVVGNLISTPSNYSKEQRDQLKALFDSSRHHRNYVMDERIKIVPIQLPSADLEKLTAAEKWTASEIAKRFRVPAFFVGGDPTHANAEQQAIMFVTYTMLPRIKCWEDAMNMMICRRNQFIKFSMEGLLRGDSTTQANYLSTLVNNGIITRNEARSKIDFPPVGPEGDVLIMQMNQGSLADIVAGKYANSSSADVWNEPAEESRKKETIREKRAREYAMFEKAAAPAKSSRKKMESLIRKHVKECLARIREEMAAGKPVDYILDELSTFIDEVAGKYRELYKAIYIGVIKKMVPSVQEQCDSDASVSESAIEAFAESYSDSLAGRVGAKVYKVVSPVVGTEEYDDAEESLAESMPVEESEEEVHRSSNAMSLFLYQQLGVTTFHIVASPDACSFCGEMDGKVASVEGYVLQKGDAVSDGDGGVRHISKNFRHPPFHSHCTCGVAPGDN